MAHPIRWTGLALICAAATLSACAGGGSAGANNQGPSNQMLLPPEEDARANIAVAQSLEEGGADRDAIEHYERARSLDAKNNQWVCRRLAVLYDREGDTYRAEREYKNAYRLYPNDANLLNDMGYFYYSRERLAEAEEFLRRAVSVDPKNDRAWVNLGILLAEDEQYDEAFEAFIHTISPAEARANIGVIMAKHGKFEEAEQEIQRALSQQPDLQRYASVIEYIRAQQAGEDVEPPAELEVETP